MTSAFALLASLFSFAAGQDVFVPSRQLRGSLNTSRAVAADEEKAFAAPNAMNTTSPLSAAAASACCSWCPYHGYCSPVSHSCYNSRRKHYYHSCSLYAAPNAMMDNNASLPLQNTTSSLSAAAASAEGSLLQNTTSPLSAAAASACCSWCPHHGYCSPVSHSCYRSRRKHYYHSCSWYAAPNAMMDNNTSLPLQNTTSSLSAAAASAGGSSLQNTTSSLSAAAASAWGSSCCSWCPHHGYCSPRSNSCYHSRRQGYYHDCSSPRPRPVWQPSGWCPRFSAMGFHPGNCKKSYTGSWYQWICTQYGRTTFCSSDCKNCNT